MARHGAKYRLTILLTEENKDPAGYDEGECWSLDVQLRKGNFIKYSQYELAQIAKEGAKKALIALDRVKVNGDCH